MLLLDNEAVAAVVDMPAMVGAMRRAFEDLSCGGAAVVDRVDVISEGDGGAVHSLKTMAGVALGHAVARVDSDLLTWPTRDGVARREKAGSANSRIAKENGLLLVYRTATGELVAILQDGEIQRQRVGATSAYAATLLGPAVEQVNRVGVLGAGYQAQTQIDGLLAVYTPQVVAVYSPREDRRTSFVEGMRARHGDSSTAFVPMDSPRAAVDGSQVVVGATNALTPIMQAEWISPGTHVNAIKRTEIDRPLLDRCARVAIGSYAGSSTLFAGVDPARFAAEDDPSRWWRHEPYEWRTLPDLAAVAGDPARYGRRAPDEITVFVAQGSGVQFAAACAQVLEAAEAAGVGRDLPDSWFLQTLAS